MARDIPSYLELQVLGVLWDRGSATVREVLDELNNGKQRAYTTILTILQHLERKGYVTHKAVGVTHHYRSKKQKNTILRPLLQLLVNRVFSGSQAQMLDYAMQETRVTPDELEALKKIIREYESQHSKKSSKKKS